ncbi:hypothetical protein P692DRAFT_201869884 [Suillus brevipes Sb2]|nr:hypothetical protein P692DRAFT_201869884 [Suillus brevipes Sb2]
MVHRRRVTVESSSSSDSDSDSDCSSASSHKTSPTSPMDKSAHSSRKRKRKSSDNGDDDKTRCSNRPQLQKDHNEEPSHQERTKNPGEIHLGEVQQVIITAIRAADLTLGLRRIPAGFHVVFEADGVEYQTSNKSVHVDQAVVEWHERILLPREPSSKVWVSVYASFELGPMLCHGELLRTFEISVGELLDRSEKSHPIIFPPKQDEVISACSSLFMTLEQQLSDENDIAVLCPPTTLTSGGDVDTLAPWTDSGHRLLAQYRRMQNRRDLDQSIDHFEHALDICPMDHPCRPAALFNLATAKLINCQANETYPDLDIPISIFQDALDLRPTGHPDRPITQLHLAIALLSRFTKRGFQTDVHAAKELLREVIDVCHANSHIHRAALLAIETSDPAACIDANNLGQEWPAASMLRLSPGQLADQVEWCLQTDDDPRALDEAISHHYNALGYYSTTHASRGQLLCDLRIMLDTRFERRGNAEDLDQAIALQREVLAWHPVGHPDRSTSLDDLANGLSTRFDHRGNDEDLDQAIALGREALALRPVGHTDRSMSLNNLAVDLSTRFHHRGNAEDLDQAIALQREGLSLLPVGHTDRSMSLNNLAAIALQREVLAWHPVGHPDRSTSLDDLANGLSTRFDHRGNDEDLDQAIALGREALALRPVGHTDRSMSLNNLAVDLSTRFHHRGNAEDLDQAIALQREGLSLLPVGHTDRSMSLNNLAVDLSTRFHHRGNAEDLDQAIALGREALALCPVGHTDRPMTLGNLAVRLSTRFDHRGNAEDLDQAIALHREGLSLLPVGHTDRSMSLNNLAVDLSTRFHHRGNAEDLDEAIALAREALALRPVGHPDRSKSLGNLAVKLSTRFDHRGDAEDLNESRENLRCALTLLTQHDPHRLLVHRSLANVYLSFHRTGLEATGGPGEDTDSLNVAMHHYKAAAKFVPGGLLFRLRASLHWVRRADQHRHATELEAYGTSMQLMDAYMSATASVSSRRRAMKDFPSTLAVDAASCALRNGDVRRAVELLEQGRTIIWTQMTRLRTPLDTLQIRSDHAAALMKRFRDLSSLLDRPPASHADATQIVDVEAADARYRRLVEDWNGVVEEIRKVEGFSRFLLPPVFADLHEAACDGPIIVLIASESSCDAIIIPHKQSPTSIRLPTNLEKLQTLVVRFQRTSRPALAKALIELWDDVVRPVVDILGGFARRHSRIWWCPTSVFNFLPLHAAGEYRFHGQFLSQLYISSYTPSLTALIKARRHDRSLLVSFAAIGQDHPPGASFTLECVEPELELVRNLLPPPPTISFTKITSVDATRSRALRALQDNTWLHFSCHGTQNNEDPFNSAFLMRDRPLSLLDITQTDLSQHEFAFLSACDTAAGDPSTPDEVIHLAAGLQFAGVKSVVGTLWKVTDATVQRLVEEFYKNFCKDGKMNSKRAARALHQAVQSLASDKDLPLEQRILFVHIGI